MSTPTAYPRLVRSLGLDPADDAADCGRVLAGWRESTGLSPAELGERAGTTEQAVVDFEAGLIVPAHPELERYLLALDA